MIIEFIGAPGSGKTTLSPTVIECLREHGLQGFSVIEAARPCARRSLLGKVASYLAPAAWQGPLLWQVFYQSSTLYELKFCARHPRLIKQVIVSQRRRPTAAAVRQRRVRHWFFRLTGYYEFLRGHLRRNEALILDEGFLHRVVQLYASSVEAPDSAQIAEYIDLLPTPDLVIFTQAPPAVCEQRIYRRGLWERFQQKSPEEISRFVANAYRVVHLAVEHAAAKGWQVLEVDNSDSSPEAAQAQLREKLTVILPPVSAQPALPSMG
jgi:thymidylate kinase